MKEIIKEENQEIKIPFDGLFKDFKDHLDINGNFKILFSGKFGIGKSYFLKEFFENHKDEYEVFHLFPINYQISSNEDIFDFLKYDILIELLNKDKQRIKELKEEGFIELFDENEKNYLFSFIKEKFSLNLLARKGAGYIEELGSFKASFLTNSIEIDFGLGKMLGRFFQDLLAFDEELQKYKKGDNGKIEKFIEKIKPRIITETDIFSQIIKEKVESLKILNNKKQSVLILDDLDRMDPEHIFRILNIFSAHFEKTENNKFGFDKIILVADYQNLKSIFHHKYGENTDESGYFDKFFDKGIYNFSIESLINEFVVAFIENKLFSGLNTYDNIFPSFFRLILFRSLEVKKINLRCFLKGLKFKELNNNFSFDCDLEYCINFSLKILLSIFNNQKSDFLEGIKEIKIYLRSENTSKNKYLFNKNLVSNRIGLVFLEKFEIIPDLTGQSTKNWKDFTIHFSENRITKITYLDTDKELPMEWLFFDLLFDYIEKDYHLSEN